MIPQDLLIVTRRFWPHCGLTEMALSDLALNLKDAGHNVTVATVKWSKDWSENVSYHGIPVFRFARPVTGPWSSFRYARSLAKHFAIRSYDGIIVSGLGDEVAAVTRSVDELTPVVLRVDEGLDGVEGKLHRKHVENCLAADAIVANREPVANCLLHLDGMPVVTVVRDGLRTTRNRTLSLEERIQIRTALSDVHPVLKIGRDQPLVVACSRMNSDCGTGELVKAWPMVVSRYPKARLWLIGDGKRSSQIWQLIVKLDLVHSVMMPGFFDDLEDVLVAADLFVHPSRSIRSGDGLFRAMSAGLPSIVCENHWTRSFVIPGVNAELVTVDDANILATAIVHGLVQTDAREKFGDQAKRTVERLCSPEKQVEKYLELLSCPSHEVVVGGK